MSKFKRMRLFRQKHSISLAELSGVLGVSHQYLSMIELSEDTPTPYQKALIYRAFQVVIAIRQAQAQLLKTEYESAKGSLFDLADSEKE